LFSAESQRCDDASSRQIGSAAPDEELGLSAELQVLASHLRGEADSLAERYAPSTSPQPHAVDDHRLMRRWMWPSVAIGVAGLALLAWRIDRWQQSPPVAPTPSVAQLGTHSAVADLHQPSDSSASPATVAPASVAPASVASTDPAVLRHSQGIAEVGMDAPAVERHPPADQVEMLRIQVSGFEKVIRKLQAELVARDAAQIEAQKQIESLQAEVAALRSGGKEPRTK